MEECCEGDDCCEEVGDVEENSESGNEDQGFTQIQDNQDEEISEYEDDNGAS